MTTFCTLNDVRMSEADSRFLADNMLTADDFDIPSFLEEADNMLDLSSMLPNNECENLLDRYFPFEIKNEQFSPSPSPAGSSSGYSSPEDAASIADCDVAAMFPDSPPEFSSSTYTQPIGAAQLPANVFQFVVNGKVPIPAIKRPKREIKPERSKLIQPQPLVFGALTGEQKSQRKQQLVTMTRERTTNVPVLPNHVLDNTKTEIAADDKTTKRQQRMIKNRESAYLSRKKKREYVQSLEEKISEISSENNSLKYENCALRDRISTLDEEITKLKKLFSVKDLKKNTCLAVMLFMVTLNLAPLTGILSSSSSPAFKKSIEHPKLGRTLLWNPPSPSSDEDIINFNDQESDDLLLLASEVRNKSCPTFVNKTESVRLENELRVWALRVEKEKIKSAVRRPLPSLKALRKQLAIPMPQLHNLMRGANRKLSNQKASPEGAASGIEVYHPTGLMYEDLFEALDRRDDTFYFVSFSGDHLLLPATAHNRTNRPKMSLVMPAMTFNDTTKSDRITMMQIDCEVMNTKLVQVKESAIPVHMRHNKVLNETNVKQPTTNFTQRRKRNA